MFFIFLFFVFSIDFIGMGDVSGPKSEFQILNKGGFEKMDKGLIEVEVLDSERLFPLPARVIITASDGKKLDAVGRGLYSDGRFYVEGKFSLESPPGEMEIKIYCGPNYLPLDMKVSLEAGRKILIRAEMKRWFSPEREGWYCGDNHLHTSHDPTGDIKVDEHYTALQARAEGLDYITESDGQWGFEEELSGSDFLFRSASEIHTGVFTGHANTPGIEKPIPNEDLSWMRRSLLPFQYLCEIVHELGGAVIYTHTSPLPRLHWMGATESLYDAILGNCADAFDVANRGEELIWFAILNLGNRIAVSGSTDAVLLRRDTIPPGARRVYAKAGKLDYKSIVEAIRKGRTFATNGGPIFPFFNIDGKEVGEVIEISSRNGFRGKLEIHHLHPLKSVEIIRKGKIYADLLREAKSVSSSQFTTSFMFDIEEGENAWYVARVEDERGNWAITSPIYFSKPNSQNPKASLIAMEIGNFTRFCELRPQFYVHIIVSTSLGRLKRVLLLRDGKILREFSSEEGNFTPSGKLPVTEMDGEYQEGWTWHPNPARAYHFQADYPVKESGWYKVIVETESGKASSDEIYFDGENPNSQQISLLNLKGENMELRLWGYGEEMAIKDIMLPFEGDHWWYPQNEFWEIEASFEGHRYLYSGGYEKAKERFKKE